jgi:hypothetical protein
VGTGLLRPQHTHLDAHLALMDQLPLRTLCSFCGWSCEGTTLECREKAIEHRAQAHPDLVVRRRRPGGGLNSFRQPTLSKADWKEVYAERDRRAKLLGIDLGAGSE